MKDLVSRSEVLRILRRKLYCGYRDIDGDWVEGTIDKSAIEEVENLSSEQSWEWIPITDGLPKEKRRISCVISSLFSRYDISWV